MAEVRHRPVRTPVVMQMEVVECGAACLGIVLGYFGLWRPLEELRKVCAVGRDGCTAADIRRAAEQYGLRATGWRKRVDQLRGMSMPLILFWEFNHFVVLEGVRRDRFLINDPGSGRRSVGATEFSRSFTGLVLAMAPGPDFKRNDGQPRILGLLWPWLRDFRPALAFAAGCGLLLALPRLALPLLLAGYVDHVLAAGEYAWGGVLAGAMLAGAVLLYLLTWVEQRCLRHISVQLSVRQAGRFLTRLFRLPSNYFERRQSGDLTARLQSIDEVAAAASGQVVRMAIELVTGGLFLVLLLTIDAWLAAGVAALALVCASLMRVVTRFRVDSNQTWRREQGLLAGVETMGMTGIDAALATATEDDLLLRMSGYQAREVVARQRFLELGQLTASFPTLFQILGGALVLGYGGGRVMAGEMSLGLLMGAFFVADQFLRPVGRFVEFADRFRTLEADLLRIDDVLAAEPDVVQDAQPDRGSGRIATIEGRLRLAGRVEFERVTFGYRRGSPLIEDFSLSIEPGQRVAIVGPSASGKSTLAGLLAGIHRPWSGRVSIDGRPRDEISSEILARSIALVDQRVLLFSGTIRDNLTLWNRGVLDEDMVAAARDAAIHDEIMARSQDYDSLVVEGGRNFSGGQRQRMEIARALVTKPTVLILDEATASLDALTEANVDDALRRRGCTCFIVAHRLSTIRDSDLIIVLDGGREAARGSHEELMAQPDGIYRQLVGEA